MRDPENAPDELLEIVAPNRYIHRKLADPNSEYLVIAQRSLDRVKKLCEDHGIYDELKALDIEVVPYNIDTSEE
jgi:hypothetical protein